MGAAGVVTATVAGLVTGVVITAGPASATTPNPTPLAGSRRSATALSFPVSGTSGVSVDVGTGNGLFVDKLVTLPGVTGNVPIDLWYNTSVFGTSTPSAVTGTNGTGWGITGFDQRLVSNGDGSVTYYGVGGLSGVFTPSGSTFVTPAQFRATLATVAGGGWTLTDHTSNEKLTFNSAGRLVTDADKAGNATTYAYSSGLPSSVTSSRGPSAGRVLTVHLTGSKITSLTQSSGTLSRTITFGYTSGGNFGSVTDAVAGVTSFASAYGTDTGQVVTITGTKATTLGFAAGGQVASVAQTNPSIDGGAGTSTTRLTYPSATQTLAADPTTNQSSAVSAVPHTTYTLNSATQLVTSAQDPDGNTRSTTYSPLGDVASTTPASPSSGSTTSYSYPTGTNGGESLTQVSAPTGASDSAAYSNTGASQYLPSSSTDDAGNALVYKYDTQGNQTSVGQTATGPQATVSYNSDGTPSTSGVMGASTTTAYGYDTSSPTTHDLVSTTFPTGSTLGTRNYTWDALGRLATATDGRGNTITYTYDKLDRITKVDYSDAGTTDVTYTYNSFGEPLQRVDGSGTTTYTYDDLGQLLTVANTAGGGTITYTYDLNGDLASTADSRGTVTYVYDNAHLLTSMTYPKSSGTQTTYFANDANGRRTDTWLASNATHSTWGAHSNTTYDASGRPIHVTAQDGPATSPSTSLDLTYCYAAGATAPSCPTTSTADRSKLRWVTDAVTGETTTYGYDTMGRLTSAAVTGGSNPRTYSYSYDTAGNRLTSVVTGSSPSSQSLTYNGDNQITSTGYGYDAAGNETTNPSYTASYNTAGQRVGVVKTGVHVTYTYAGTNQNELTNETIPGGTSYSYTYGRAGNDGLPEIEQVHEGSNTAYIDHDNTGQPVVLYTSNGTAALYVEDGRGDPAALITEYGVTAFAQSFDPYGTGTYTANSGGSGTGQNPYAYGLGIQDRGTGTIKYGQRWYDPTTGNWQQQDALNAPLDPNNANRYAYAGGDPINNADPTGRSGLGDIAAGLGIVGGGLLAVASLPADAAVGLAIGGAALVGAAGGILVGVGVSECDYGECD